MSTIRIPGKVMLAGEYAVLNGGLSVLLPLQQSLRISQSPTEPEEGYPAGVEQARSEPIARLTEHEGARGVPHAMVDTSEFRASWQEGPARKLGLGGSAAEVVGMLALRYAAAGLSWVQHWREIAEAALIVHRKLQGGVGSGADTTAAALRRPLRYRLSGGSFTAEELPAPRLAARPVLNLLWTGQPADTRELVGRFARWCLEASDDDQTLCARMKEASDACAAAWFTASQDELLALIDESSALLIECLARASVTYQLPIHARISAWARKHGGRAKPTGAGGGDMILLIGELPLDQLDNLIMPLDYALLWPGIR